MRVQGQKASLGLNLRLIKYSEHCQLPVDNQYTLAECCATRHKMKIRAAVGSKDKA